MISDSTHSASIPVASPNAKEFVKKKRVNRSAKLKQCKLDARREQWLSQVKNKDVCKNEVNGGWGAREGRAMHLAAERGHMIDKLELKPRYGEESYGDGSSMHHCSGTESSPSYSPTSHISVSVSNHSGTTFTVSSRSCSRTSSSRSSSISSNGCYWGNMSEEDDDGCLDDWEAVADALAVADKVNLEQSPDSAFVSPTLGKHGNSVKSSSHLETILGIDSSHANPENGGTARRPSANCRAWGADDDFRPQCLPVLSKQYSLPLNSERRLGCEGSVWGRKNVRPRPVPTSCPICCEDLDCTDSSFIPCLCEFRLCLFCHNKILEEDGRCPGCRKQYSHDPVEGEAEFDSGRLTYRLVRSCSMITRS